ncbi:MAG: hypothetical protein M3467_04730 [Actinomycetota bacterium]|nr:hypothetical protein [Actinomycetota bacterium]
MLLSEATSLRDGPQPLHRPADTPAHRGGEAGLITDQELTAGNEPDGPVGVALLDGEDAPVEALADSAYGSGATRKALGDAGHSQTIKPLPTRPAVPGGFGRDDFAVDHTRRTVTCPRGVTAAMNVSGVAHFAGHCTACPLRARCTSADRRPPNAASPPPGALPRTATQPPVAVPARRRDQPAKAAQPRPATDRDRLDRHLRKRIGSDNNQGRLYGLQPPE